MTRHPQARARALAALALFAAAAWSMPGHAAADHGADSGAQLATAGGKAIRLVLEHHRFSPAELHVRAGAPVVIVLENRDDTPEEFECRRLRKEYGLRGHQSGTFTIHPPPAGRYEFTGEFHADTARGVLIVQ